MRLIGYACCALALTACSDQQSAESPADTAPPTSPPTSPSDTADGPPRPPASQNVPTAPSPVDQPTSGEDRTSRSETRNCYFEVDGIVRVDGPCLVFPMGQDSYTLNTWDRGKPARSHFAVVSKAAGGPTTATWNADPDDIRAFDALGTVLRQADGCWINERTRICAR